MDLELRDRVFVVTGGSDGLGAASVVKLSTEGARVSFCARGKERLDEVAKRCPGDVLPFPADVRSAADCERFVSATVERFGRIDGIINNAGTSAGRPFESITDADWQADLELKLLASARMTRLCLPKLSERGGSVLFVLAISAKGPTEKTAPSSASRAAGMALAKSLSHELGPRSIRVNSVFIGKVESGQWRRRAEQAGHTDVADYYRAEASKTGIPLGRFGRAEEFADLAAFLMSPRAAYVSGANINFDGALSAAY